MPRGPDQPIPEFLQRRAAEQAQQVRMRPPRETVVPVLDDHALTEEAPGLSPFELSELEREITRAQARPRRSLAPEMMPLPPVPPLRGKKRAVAGDNMGGFILRLGLVALGVIALLIFIGRIALPTSWKSAAAEPLKRLAGLVRSSPAPAPLPKPAAPQAVLPKLVVEGADAGGNDEIGLGVRMSGPIEGVMAIVTGLATGTKLSRGQPWGENEWFVPASELADAKLRPPANFSGTMQYTVALKTSDGKIADRQTLRLQWSQPQKRESKLRNLDPEEIAVMVKRGETLFENGDIAGARLLLQRAAEGGDQTAAMAMAATYDPVVMTNLAVRGVAADVEKARFWYEKAREYGSKEAPQRLESLASQGR
jgi:hypothetical protein